MNEKQSFADAASVLHYLWRDSYTCPNDVVYPWMWLWDSCFTSLVWADIDVEKALTEVRSVLSLRTESGFIAHMGYQRQPQRSIELWGVAGRSTITQPPMYGHTLAELARKGIAITEDDIDAAILGLQWLLRNRRRQEDELLFIVHPWENGVDDSARWDGFLSEPYEREQWRQVKQQLVLELICDEEGCAVDAQRFVVQNAGFNALVAFNLREIGELAGRSDLMAESQRLTELLEKQWDEKAQTWRDLSQCCAPSSAARTLDSLLGVLVTTDKQRAETVLRAVIDNSQYGGEFGPAGVHRSEETFSADAYWRGPAWPQLSYLFWVAARQHQLSDVQKQLAEMLQRGARESNWSEYWNPDTAQSSGASPQSWSTLSAIVR